MDTTYTLEIIAEITGVSAQTILHYQEQGLIFPLKDSHSDLPYFNEDALRRLRRIEYLRISRKINVSELKLILNLMDEVDHLQKELRFKR